VANEPPARLAPVARRPVTLVDSGVILDIVTDDPAWSQWSADALAHAADDGPLVINPIVYAEVSVGFDRIEDLDDVVPADDFQRETLPYEAGFLAGKAFLAYRRRGGQKRSPLPDFYIGAHAAVRGYRLLTRDAARYRTCFATVTLISPEPGRPSRDQPSQRPDQRDQSG
jgi:predicted nucleic acid-binding protein